MVFGHERGQRYPWDGFVVLWGTSDFFAFYGSYLGSIDGFCSADVVCGNFKVPDLVLLGNLF